MGMLMMPLILQLAKLCIIGFVLVVQGSSGHNASPSPANFSVFPPIEGIPGSVEQRSGTPSTLSQPDVSDLHSPPALPPLMSASAPKTTEGHAHSLSPSNSMEPPAQNKAPPPFTIKEHAPSLAPSSPVVLPPFSTAPPPLLVQVHTPSKSPTAPQKKEPVTKSPLPVPDAPAPVASPSRNLPQNSPNIHPFPSITPSQNSPENSPIIHLTPVAPPLRNSPQISPAINSSRPSAFPPIANQKNSSNNNPPVLEPSAPAPVAPQLRNPSQNPRAVHSNTSSAFTPIPSANQGNPSNSRAPVMEPIAPAPIATPWISSPRNQTSIHSRRPTASPPSVPIPEPTAPVASPPKKLERTPPPVRPIMPPSISPAPVAPQLRNPSQNPRAVHSNTSSAFTPIPSANQGNPSNSRAPVMEPIAPGPIATPWISSPRNQTPIHSRRPTASPPSAPIPEPTASVASPPRKLERTPPPVRPIMPPSISPAPVALQLRNPSQNPRAVHSNTSSAFTPIPSANQGNPSNSRAPVMEPIAPAPIATPWISSPRNQTPIHSRRPAVSPPSAPIPEPTASVASPPRKLERTPPPVRPIMPPSISPVSVVSPSRESPHISPTIHPNVSGGTPSQLPDPDISPVLTPPSSNDGIPVASPTDEIHKLVPPVNHIPKKGSSPAMSPSVPTAIGHPGNSHVPSFSPLDGANNSPALPPSILFHKHQHTRNERTSPAPASSYLISPPPLKKQGPVISPAFLPGRRQRHYAPAPLHSVSPPHSTVPSSVSAISPVPSSVSAISPVPSPSPMTASRQTKMPLISPKVSHSASPLTSPKEPPPPPVMSFPPPPPNEDCSTTICTEPYTNRPPGSQCGCVLPMQVGLSLSVALYTFFPLVSELAEEIAAGVFMKQSQVRIIGANAASEQPEKTVVLIDLVPLGEKFDTTTAFLTYQRFWHKQVAIKTSLFGDYEVLYVRYLGLPPSPPLPPSDIGIIDGGPYPGNDNNARAIRPLGVDVHRKRHKYGLSGGVIAIIVLSMLVAVVLCSAIAWVLLFKHRDHASQQAATPQHLPTSLAKPSGSIGSMVGSGPSSTSLSFGSSIVAYAGSAKTFSASEIEKATDNFDASRILGEGGFGRVYSGVLEDGTKVAVKVLKRDDQQGGREFLAEVEMLSRLHHRNLVKLIGICTEEHSRSLVYELVPNGSVESHLHGVDKESTPLDWDARIKIALGAARGLAYLHEDSSPRVIHRDFKASNILLEHDFTPKVSDFGLARTAMDEEGRHISTRVMGTFGYVAPEYAMTGHLLVKSDVYSYGVVLLELLTGRKPVDMTQPPGQENLVAWARPLLASKEGLETIIDHSLGFDIPFDSVAKVAAIASMCVQPEVSHRPFMGEVVQALKLVCNECDEAKEVGSRDSSQDDFSIDLDARVGTGSGQLIDPLQSQYSVPNYDSGLDTERGLSVSDLFSSSTRFGRQSSESFRRHCSSGPLRTGRGSRFWEKMQRLSRGSISEHGVTIRFRRGSH
ncbi:hypothetical protein REPUB_Repub03eG0066100 [Reevesia pubescens]